MPRTQLLEQSALRAELDQRSREARLRQEQVERLLVVRPPPRQSMLRRVVRRLRWRIYVGGQTEDRSDGAILSGTHAGRGPQAPGETSSAAGGLPAAPPAVWPRCPNRGRVSFVRSDTLRFKPW
jgi:hypothetical protein